jgi:hypothetical protein
MRQVLLTLLLWPEVNGQKQLYVNPGFDHHNELDLKHFGSKIQMMMTSLPDWQQKFVKSLIPSENDFHHDPRIEALNPENEFSLVAKRAIEKYYGEKLEEEPPEEAQKFADPAEVAPENSDQPPVTPVEHQTEDEEEDNFLWLAVGGVALGAAAVWVWSTRSRQPILNVDGEDVSLNAGYAKMPEKRKQPTRTISDSESSGADRGSRSTTSHSNAAGDIYSSIRKSLQDTDPGNVWKSVRQSFSADAAAGNGGSSMHTESGKQPHSQQPGTAEASSVSHTDSEEEITEVYDRVKKSLKNLNLLPRKSQELTKDMPPPKGGSSGSSFR